jgi:hypothetical protein
VARELKKEENGLPPQATTVVLLSHLTLVPVLLRQVPLELAQSSAMQGAPGPEKPIRLPAFLKKTDFPDHLHLAIEAWETQLEHPLHPLTDSAQLVPGYGAGAEQEEVPSHHRCPNTRLPTENQDAEKCGSFRMFGCQPVCDTERSDAHWHAHHMSGRTASKFRKHARLSLTSAAQIDGSCSRAT